MTGGALLDRPAPRQSTWGRGGQRALALTPEAERQRAAETMQERRYKAWRRQRMDDLLAGPHGGDVAALRVLLRRLGPQAAAPIGGRDLVAHVTHLGWLRGAPDDTRLQVLGLLGAALVWAREKRGLEPFDDPLWDQPPNAFQMIRDLLRERVVAAEEPSHA